VISDRVIRSKSTQKRGTGLPELDEKGRKKTGKSMLGKNENFPTTLQEEASLIR